MARQNKILNHMFLFDEEWFTLSINGYWFSVTPLTVHDILLHDFSWTVVSS
jgi:hypothetical protein